MFLKKNMITIALFSALVFNGCGNDDEKKDSNDNTTLDLTNDSTNIKLTKGYLLDSAVGGVTYSCGDITGVTLSSGEFACETTPVTFSIGSYELGAIDSFTLDTKVYPQDLVGVSRLDFTEEDVIKITQLLQSLDEDKNASNGITINEETRNELKDAQNSMTLEELAELADVSVSDKEEAINHLKEQIEGVINTNGGDVDLDEVNLDDYSVIYVYKNATAEVIEGLKTFNEDNDDFTFSDDLVDCSSLRGYVNLSSLTSGLGSVVDIPDNNFEIDVEVKVFVSLSFTKFCTEVDYINSNNIGTNSATIYWNE